MISHVNQDQIIGTEPKNASSPPSKGIVYANVDQKSTANDDEGERQCIHSISTIPSGSNTSMCMLLTQEMENTIDEALPPPSTEEEQDDESMETEDLEFIIIKSDPKTAKNGNANKSFGDAKGVSSSTVNEVKVRDRS